MKQISLYYALSKTDGEIAQYYFPNYFCIACGMNYTKEERNTEIKEMACEARELAANGILPQHLREQV